jgi:uncharacterized DUF497 family protein
MDFARDDYKAAANFRKHGVSFGEAEGVFDDPLAITAEDRQHSEQELREVIIGHSEGGRLLFVCFIERSGVIRLISARQATRQERKNMKTMISTSTDMELSLRESLSDEQVAELMADDIPPEYDIDYSKAKPNRFARRETTAKTVKLDADVAAVFPTAEAVNTALRALMQTMPPTVPRERA